MVLGMDLEIFAVYLYADITITLCLNLNNIQNLKPHRQNFFRNRTKLCTL